MRVQRHRRGASATELVLVLPVLAFIVLACVDFGRFAYHHVAVANAARAAAEYATTTPYPPGGQAAWAARVQQTARAEVTGQTNCDPAALTTTTTVAVEESGLRRVEVRATYTGFHTVVSWPGIPDNPALGRAVVMRAIR